MSQRKSKPYARKGSRSRCHFATIDGRQCTEPRSHYCLHHSSQKRRDEDSQPKITAADIFGRYRKPSAAALSHILTQTMVEFMNGRITHNQAAALTRIAQLMLRTLENTTARPKLTLPPDSWRAEVAAILSGMGTHTAQTAEEPHTTL